MHITGDISLGNLLTVATLVGILIRLGWVAGGFQEVIKALQKTVSEHTARLNKYEESLVSIVGDMQRMVGRVEGVQDRLDRWKGV